MDNSGHDRERSLLVTYRGVDPSDHTLSVVHEARGRTGQVRPVSLVVPFLNKAVYQKMRKISQSGRLNPGDQIYLRLRPVEGTHPCALVVGFTIASEVRDAAHRQSVPS